MNIYFILYLIIPFLTSVAKMDILFSTSSQFNFFLLKIALKKQGNETG